METARTSGDNPDSEEPKIKLATGMYILISKPL